MNEQTTSTEVSSSLLTELARKIRSRQAYLNMNDDELSKKSGVSKPVLSSLRSGKKAGIQLSTLERLSAALNWKIDISFTDIVPE